MDHYYLYMIRCKSCNNPLEHLKDEYLTLIETQTIEKALDILNLENYCCRQTMMNPSIVYVNKENREAIDGKIDATSINKFVVLNPTKDTSSKDRDIPKKEKMVEDEEFIETEDSGFKEPKYVGIPVINNIGFPRIFKNVGEGMLTEIITGNTFLCR